MSKKILLVHLVLQFLFVSCTENSSNVSEEHIKVDDINQLKIAIDSIKAGQTIIMANGIWKDVEIEFYGIGTKEEPITLQAESPGKVTIEGASSLKLGGEYLVVKNLHFKNGYTPSNNVIQFKIDDGRIANHSAVTNCVIQEFTQPNRDDTDHWVEFWGRHNELSNCYISGKSNFGPTVMIMLKGNEHVKNYHKIVNNHFGPRPRKGGPHGETMQIGDSNTSMTPSHTLVANNFFERCNGEVEIISSKSNYNEFRNNVFLESEGSLVLRHGNYATIDGNVFIGNDNSEFIGGIRVINTGHWITNNYFYKLKGSNFRAPLAIMNGIPKSPLNRYNQVTDVVVAFNSYIDCITPFHFSVGSNISQSDVLPATEIRSARPTRLTVANNLIYNEKDMAKAVMAYDTIDGVDFRMNLHLGKASDLDLDGFDTEEIEINQVSNNVFAPKKNIDAVYNGFEFETITSDIFGTIRNKEQNSIGAILNPIGENPSLYNKENYGTDWFSSVKKSKNPKIIEVDSEISLIDALRGEDSYILISLPSGNYTFNKSLIVNKDVTLQSKDIKNPAQLIFASRGAAFEMHPKGKLRLNNVILKGNRSQNLATTLDKNMSKAYDLFMENVTVENFSSLLEVSKGSFADTVSMINSNIKNIDRGFILNKEKNDEGDYNSAFVIIKNNEFKDVSEQLLDYYRGGYDESTIGGHLTFTGNTVSESGQFAPDNILIKNRGIVNVELANNTFLNNPIKHIAILWGEKGQEPVNNKILNSGKINVVQNLELKLMY